MITTYTRDRLQAAADYLTLRGVLRGAGTLTLIWGVLATLASFVPPQDPSALGLGLLLIAAGIWNRIQVHPSGVLVNAGVFMLVGLYNIAGNLLGMSGTEAGFGFWARVGVFQIVWGVRTLAQYPRYARLVKERPAEPDQRWMEDSIREVSKGKPKESNDLIELITFPPNARVWKARLHPEGVLLVSKSRDQVMVSARHHFQIAAGPAGKPGKPIPAMITVAGQPMKGAIKPEWLDRYRAWKGEAVEQRMPMAA